MHPLDNARRVGIITPPANPVVEPELHALLPDTLAMYSARLPVLPGDLQARNRAYGEHYVPAMRSFGTLKLEAFYIGMTGVSYRKGMAADRAWNDAMSREIGVPVATASMAIVSALAQLGIRRLCLVSPYPKWLTDESVAYWASAGLELAQVVSVADEMHPYDLDSQAVNAAMARVNAPADAAVLLTGTGLITLPTVLEWQSRFAVPVLSSNLCGAWFLSRALGVAASLALTAATPALASTLHH